MKILVTGCVGFIGFHLTISLLEDGVEILGVDNLNDYYDISLKESRLEHLKSYNNFSFNKVDISDRDSIEDSFQKSESLLKLGFVDGIFERKDFRKTKKLCESIKRK